MQEAEGIPWLYDTPQSDSRERLLFYLMRLGPAVGAGLLFVLNNLAIISGWLAPPAGYTPTLMTRTADIAQYLTWARAFSDNVLIPDYHAPWRTEPALINPFLWTLSQSARLAQLDLVTAYHLAHLLLHILAAYALFWALRVFTASRGQAVGAMLVLLCTVPLQSLAQLPLTLIGRGDMLPGIGDFVWWSSDGFFHGISGSLAVTFGTAIALVALCCLGQYLKTEERRWLVGASLAAFVSGLMHPFEVFVIASAGSLTLVVWRGRQWRRAVPEVATLGLASALGLAPYVVMTLTHPWLREAAAQNHWQPGSPLGVLRMLGLPAILALAFLVIRPRMSSPTDLLLQAWFVCTLVGIYVPFVPWSQHLFDGFHYVTALLLVRQVSHSPLAAWFRQSYPRLAQAVLALGVLLSVSAYITYQVQSFRDGRLPTPDRLFTSVAPQDEAATIAWLQGYARSDQLVLAPLDSAAWLATVPIHSFASHYLFSLTYADQARLSEAFYKGQLTAAEAGAMLNEYGVSYIVAPLDSPALAYLRDKTPRAEVGGLTIYELPGNTMKPYPGDAPRP